jgi:hypothetical protein
MITLPESSAGQVGIGFPGAGSCFGDQHAVSGQRCGNPLGHFDLLRALAITGNAGRKRTIGGKYFGERGSHAKIDAKIAGASANRTRSWRPDR